MSKYHSLLLLICLAIALVSTTIANAQAPLALQLSTEKTTLLAGEQGKFTLTLTNESTTDQTNANVAFTTSSDFELLEATVAATNGTFTFPNWTIPMLPAGASDTLQFEAISTGYAFF